MTQVTRLHNTHTPFILVREITTQRPIRKPLYNWNSGALYSRPTYRNLPSISKTYTSDQAWYFDKNELWKIASIFVHSLKLWDCSFDQSRKYTQEDNKSRIQSNFCCRHLFSYLQNRKFASRTKSPSSEKGSNCTKPTLVVARVASLEWPLTCQSAILPASRPNTDTIRTFILVVSAKIIWFWINKLLRYVFECISVDIVGFFPSV